MLTSSTLVAPLSPQWAFMEEASQIRHVARTAQPLPFFLRQGAGALGSARRSAYTRRTTDDTHLSRDGPRPPHHAGRDCGQHPALYLMGAAAMSLLVILSLRKTVQAPLL
jgi:hypothetical protein